MYEVLLCSPNDPAKSVVNFCICVFFVPSVLCCIMSNIGSDSLALPSKGNIKLPNTALFTGHSCLCSVSSVGVKREQ